MGPSPSKERNSFTCWLIKGEPGETVSDTLTRGGHCGFNKHLEHPAMPVSIHGSVHGSASYSTSRIRRSSSQNSVCGIGLKTLPSSNHSIFGDCGLKDFSSSCELSLIGNEKFTMQNLNSRLASYLQKVLSLQDANANLEQKIKEFYESRTFSRRDLSKHYIIIEDLQKQILFRTKENQVTYLKLDNANLTVADFKNKFEAERNIYLTVEADLTRLRMVLGETKMVTKDLQIQLSGLKEELVFLKKSHEEEMHMARTQQSSSVNVEVDAAPAVNLDNELQEMREKYEALILKNRQQIEQWFQTKVKNLNIEVLKSHTEITSSQTTISDLKKTYQTLEIEIKGIHAQITILQKDLVQVGTRYGEQLSQLQLYIDQLQTELQQIKANIQQQTMEYELLLDIKMRLELEIAEYRRLLEGEKKEYTGSKTKTEVHVQTRQEIQKAEEEHHSHQRRVKIIKEELVDGVVVATSVEEQMQDLAH
ncbi:keratin, type I cytoskeletal 19-like [Neoarius graeffei]|uniref:keratin, type I cytoskeletal 19-like n=1 Tax=Neoarius graeffei TaxID=443677 RepID=UPI00298C0858|nr:keratin, type I cytoskeletal 19-like [Neoarius graeffei]